MSMRSCAVRVTIFSTGGKFRPVSNFTELHALTQASHSYALLDKPSISPALLSTYLTTSNIMYCVLCVNIGTTSVGRGDLASTHDVELMGPLVTRDHWYVCS